MALTGSRIQAMMGQPIEMFWAVYVDGALVGSYLNRKAAVSLAHTKRAEIGETLASRGDKPSRVRVYRM